MMTYDDLSRDQLAARLKVAEDALVLIGWTSADMSVLDEFGTDRSKAATEAWIIWCAMVGGSEFCGPERHPDLVRITPRLAAARDRKRAETLARFGLAEPVASGGGAADNGDNR
jgi:hypothetical protein